MLAISLYVNTKDICVLIAPIRCLRPSPWPRRSRITSTPPSSPTPPSTTRHNYSAGKRQHSCGSTIATHVSDKAFHADMAQGQNNIQHPPRRSGKSIAASTRICGVEINIRRNPKTLFFEDLETSTIPRTKAIRLNSKPTSRIKYPRS